MTALHPQETVSHGAPPASVATLGARRQAVSWKCRLRAFFLVLGLWALAATSGAASQAQDIGEHTLKAAYLEKFQKYVVWPKGVFEKPESPFTVAVWGKDPFGKALDKVFKDKSYGDHPVRVQRVKEELADLKKAQIVFVPDANKGDLSKIAKELKGKPVLLVTESKGLAQKGAIVNFYLASANVRFEVNPQEAKRADLKISSALLKLARIVEDPK